MIVWWCTALFEPWEWQWIPYPGIWVASLVPIVLYIRSVTRHSAQVDRRKLVQFVGGMLVFWIASDWPLGTLGAGYLASAHMTQFLLYTLVSAPLLLLGTPEWMARKITSKLRMYRATVWLGTSAVVCGVIYNVILMTTHAPATVDALRINQFGSFAMDILWMIAGLVLWLPVVSPLPEGRVESVWAKMIYLFIVTALVAVIPASFLTFATTPLYAIYELAPRIGTMTAIEDQQIAGIIMKLGTIPIVWGTITVMWFRFSTKESQLIS
jgi:putative membrane protein